MGHEHMTVCIFSGKKVRKGLINTYKLWHNNHPSVKAKNLTRAIYVYYVYIYYVYVYLCTLLIEFNELIGNSILHIK